MKIREFLPPVEPTARTALWYLALVIQLVASVAIVKAFGWPYWATLPTFTVVCCAASLACTIGRYTLPEWGENWHAWPHCNGQASCWMHYSPPDAWCRCVCRWCRIARRFRRLDTRPKREARS
jgi:hypothetical protein